MFRFQFDYCWFGLHHTKHVQCYFMFFFFDHYCKRKFECQLDLYIIVGGFDISVIAKALPKTLVDSIKCVCVCVSVHIQYILTISPIEEVNNRKHYVFPKNKLHFISN